MDIRERHFGRLSDGAADSSVVSVDIDSFVRRLILFEQCIIETDILKEIPPLISVFGAKGFLTLLESGVVKFVCDAMSATQVGQTTILKSAAMRGGPLPLGSFRLASIGGPMTPTRKEYVSGGLQEVNKGPVSFKESKRIRSALASHVLAYPMEAGTAGVIDANSEILRRNPAVLEAIRHVVSADMQRDIGRDFTFSAQDIGGDGDFRITTDLADRLDVTAEQEHKLVERAILAVAAMDQRIRLMDSFQAVTGFQQDEVPVFEQKLSFLAAQIDPDIYEKKLERVITIGNLPGFNDLPAGTTIDAKRILQLRSDSGCRELRAWIRNIDSESDEEISNRFNDLRERMSWLTEGRAGKTVRFLVTNGVGAIPGVGAVAGPILSGVDSFLLDKVVGKPGPAVFLGKKYPSIFKEGYNSASLDELLNPASDGRSSIVDGE